MSYIRTKDDIYTLSEAYWAGNEDEILAQADTIEELCDCFVAVGNRHIVWDKQPNKDITFEQVKGTFAAYHFKIYGAIWTDKGLIYVAKMNDKGELELI